METLNTEYKEFYLNEIPYENNECKKFVKYGFTESYYNYCYEKLGDQIIKIVPKYISSYNNIKTLGTIYIGIRDDGIKTGIPLNRTENQIFDYIKNKINECKQYISNGEILDKITIIIEKMEKKKSLNKKKDILKKINKMNIIKSIEEYRYSDYIDKMNRIKRNLMKYRCKISSILENKTLKRELIYYINSKCKTSRTRKILKLELEKTIDYSPENIKITKMDKRNVMYWLTTFRDTRTRDYIKKMQKIKKEKKYRDTIYMDICKNMDYVREFSDINFYIIKLTMTQTVPDMISYIKNGKWMTPIRYIDNKMNIPLTKQL